MIILTIRLLPDLQYRGIYLRNQRRYTYQQASVTVTVMNEICSVIEVWYGKIRFRRHRQPQAWASILGNVSIQMALLLLPTL